MTYFEPKTNKGKWLDACFKWHEITKDIKEAKRLARKELYGEY